MVKKVIIGIVMIYAGVLAIILLAASYKQKITRNQFHILIQQEPEDLNPILGSMSAAAQIEEAIFKPMVQIDRNGKPIPILVKRIPTIENGGVELIEPPKPVYDSVYYDVFPPLRDYMRIMDKVVRKPKHWMRVTWDFKEGLVWEDGHPLGPDDVIFTWKVIMNDQVQARSRDVEKRIYSMVKDPNDPQRLIVIWKETYAFYYQRHLMLPKHILEKEYKKNPARFHQTKFNRKPVGNGPFRLVEWVPGNYIYLKRNENYPEALGPKAKLDSIWFQFVGDTNSMMVSLLSKHGDAITTVGVSFDQAIAFDERYGLESRSKKKFKVHKVEGITWEHLDINMDDPILKDRRVRKALMHAIDRDGIVKNFFRNELKKADSWLPPRHPGYHPGIYRYSYDPKKAISLLEQAGWDRVNEDNIRVNKAGKSLRLTLITTAGNKARERVQVAIKENLKVIGIYLDIGKNQSAMALFGTTIPQRKFQLAMYAWSFSPLSHGEEMWTIENIPSEKNGYKGDNIPGYKNRRVDNIHRLIPETSDPKERKKLFIEQQDIWIQDLPAIPLFFRTQVSITRPEVDNWKPLGTDTPVTWNCEQWAFKR